MKNEDTHVINISTKYLTEVLTCHFKDKQGSKGGIEASRDIYGQPYLTLARGMKIDGAMIPQPWHKNLNVIESLIKEDIEKTLIDWRENFPIKNEYSQPDEWEIHWREYPSISLDSENNGIKWEMRFSMKQACDNTGQHS